MILGWIKRRLRLVVGVLALLAAVVIFLGVRSMVTSRDKRIADLITQLASSEETREIEKGLYAKKVIEVEDLKDLITKLGEDNTKLAEIIEQGKMEVISLTQLVVKWKNAYSAAVAANQTEVPPTVPGDPPRKRVEFDGPVGPMRVWGHTLTDPPQAFLNWEQTVPIKMAIAITKNRDGTFSVLAQATPDDVRIDVEGAFFDRSIFALRWYQRVWVDLGIEPLGTKGVQVGLSYRMNKWSLGLYCRSDAATADRGCGAAVGYRPFR